MSTTPDARRLLLERLETRSLLSADVGFEFKPFDHEPLGRDSSDRTAGEYSRDKHFDGRHRDANHAFDFQKPSRQDRPLQPMRTGSHQGFQAQNGSQHGERGSGFDRDRMSSRGADSFHGNAPFDGLGTAAPSVLPPNTTSNDSMTALTGRSLPPVATSSAASEFPSVQIQFVLRASSTGQTNAGQSERNQIATAPALRNEGLAAVDRFMAITNDFLNADDPIPTSSFERVDTAEILSDTTKRPDSVDRVDHAIASITRSYDAVNSEDPDHPWMDRLGPVGGLSADPAMEAERFWSVSPDTLRRLDVQVEQVVAGPKTTGDGFIALETRQDGIGLVDLGESWSDWIPAVPPATFEEIGLESALALHRSIEVIAATEAPSEKELRDAILAVIRAESSQTAKPIATANLLAVPNLVYPIAAVAATSLALASRRKRLRDGTTKDGCLSATPGNRFR